MKFCREMTTAQTRIDENAGMWRNGFEWEIVGAGVEEVWAVTAEFLKTDKWAPKLVQSCELVEGEPQKHRLCAQGRSLPHRRGRTVLGGIRKASVH